MEAREGFGSWVRAVHMVRLGQIRSETLGFGDVVQ